MPCLASIIVPAWLHWHQLHQLQIAGQSSLVKKPCFGH